MGDLVNEFSWSFSRHIAFKICKRQYYYRYYGFWGGWEEDADKLTRKLYLLSKMTTIPMLAGKIVHKMINIVLEALRNKREIPVEKAEQKAIEDFRASWRQSKRGEWKSNPKWKTNLFEHYYEENLSEDYLLEVKETLVESIRGFYLSDSFNFIKTISPNEWLCKEKLNTFDFSRTRVWVKLDFATRHGERIYIYDWKTGKKVTEDETQLAVYALYALSKWEIELKEIRLFDVYLKKQLPVKVKLSKALISKAEDVISQSIDAMKETLDDVSENKASINNFPMIEDTGACKRCSFKGVCYPDNWREL